MLIMRNISLLILIFTIVLPTTAAASINYNGQSYGAPFAGSSTQVVGDALNNLPISDFTSSSPQSSGVKLWNGIEAAFSIVATWISSSTGIHISSGLQTIGTWIVAGFNWFTGLLKAVL